LHFNIADKNIIEGFDSHAFLLEKILSFKFPADRKTQRIMLFPLRFYPLAVFPVGFLKKLVALGWKLAL
jgi:hypothetical protein